MQVSRCRISQTRELCGKPLQVSLREICIIFVKLQDLCAIQYRPTSLIMAPTKFVAPLKKNGAESFSFSSNMSSNGSLTKSPEVIPSSQPSVLTVQASPLPADDTAEKLGEPAPSAGSQELAKPPTMKRPMFQGPPKVANTTNSQDPPMKKQKRDSNTQSSVSGHTPPAICDDDDDKENQKPLKSKKKETEDKRPCKALTDQQYDLIFQAVLSKYPCDEDSESSNQKADQTDTVDESFQLSQSDIEDDTEDKASKSTKLNLKVKADYNANASATTKSLDSKTADEQPFLPETTSGLKDSENSQSQTSQVNSQITGVPASPCITYMCHLSQPDPGRGVTQSKSPSKFEDLLDNSQGLTAAKSNICSENFVTPQKTATKKSSVTPVKGASAPTVSSSQDLPSTPIVKTSIQPSPSLQTPLSTSSRTSSTLQSSQKMPKSPFTTPQRSLPSSQVESSQEPLTPKCMPYQQSSAPGTPQSALLKVSSPVVSTPRGSQQLSQELQHTPPPKGLSAKERLRWLQEKRVTGVWVQCDETCCGKWRLLPDCHDPSTIPEVWKCSMHPDESLNHCDAEEKRLSLLQEEDMIFNKYSPGSLVWAKLSGYPWWPAMVEDDPDLEMFYWLNLFSDIPTWYHVVFFDDMDRPRTRAWVQVERLQNFESRPIDEDLSPELVGYKKRVSAAVKIATTAKGMSMKDRLDRFSFAVSYKGPIGGPSKKKYQGPIGHREAITE